MSPAPRPRLRLVSADGHDADDSGTSCGIKITIAGAVAVDLFLHHLHEVACAADAMVAFNAAMQALDGGVVGGGLETVVTRWDFRGIPLVTIGFGPPPKGSPPPPLQAG